MYKENSILNERWISMDRYAYLNDFVPFIKPIRDQNNLNPTTRIPGVNNNSRIQLFSKVNAHFICPMTKTSGQIYVISKDTYRTLLDVFTLNISGHLNIPTLIGARMNTVDQLYDQYVWTAKNYPNISGYFSLTTVNDYIKIPPFLFIPPDGVDIPCSFNTFLASISIILPQVELSLKAATEMYEMYISQCGFSSAKTVFNSQITIDLADGKYDILQIIGPAIESSRMNDGVSLTEMVEILKSDDTDWQIGSYFMELVKIGIFQHQAKALLSYHPQILPRLRARALEKTGITDPNVSLIVIPTQTVQSNSSDTNIL